ncbi:MAG: UDP-N-acetylglucosamine 2-epimerase (non-hydrolyzing), partial [Flavobacteriales bacterium]|nr:UDP-N-acetylglucosamine 2-epimerase (non-hydrolyzing) [Flavobacteriales bacterium]
MKKIITIVGARPQFIKAAAISRAIREHFEKELEEYIIHTGQHYDPDMSEVFFKEMQMPRENLNLNVGSGSHGAQ